MSAMVRTEKEAAKNEEESQHNEFIYFLSRFGRVFVDTTQGNSNYDDFFALQSQPLHKTKHQGGNKRNHICPIRAKSQEKIYIRLLWGDRDDDEQSAAKILFCTATEGSMGECECMRVCM